MSPAGAKAVAPHSSYGPASARQVALVARFAATRDPGLAERLVRAVGDGRPVPGRAHADPAALTRRQADAVLTALAAVDGPQWLALGPDPGP